MPPSPDASDAVVPSAGSFPSAQRTRHWMTQGFAALSRLAPDGAPRLVVIAILASVAVAIVGRGQPDDEGEHLHAAYLIGHWGERPHRDFFQHHPAFLWTLLSPIFRFGPTSPTIATFAGRGVVAIALLATWLGLARIARIARGSTARLTDHATSGALLLALTVAVYPESLALRPETIGLPLLVWGWSSALGRHAAAAFGGGFLAGMACEAAPRFLSVLPIFAIPPLMERLRRDWRHVAWLLAGGAAGFAGAAFMTGQTAAEVLFDIQFSALLQKIGAGSSTQLPSMAGVLLCVFLFFRHALPTNFRAAREYAAWEAAAWLVLVAGAVSAWPFLYGQALIPLVAVVAIMMAHAEGAFARSPLPAAGTIVVIGTAVATIAAAVVTLSAGSTVFDTLESRESLAAAMRPGDTILMRSRLHPIVVKDASFYPVLLMDSPRRTTRAVQAARTRWNLPAVDYAADIRRNRPQLLDSAFVFEVTPDKAPDFLPWLEANYRQVSRVLLIRNDALQDGDEAGRPADASATDDDAGGPDGGRQENLR